MYIGISGSKNRIDFAVLFSMNGLPDILPLCANKDPRYLCLSDTDLDKKKIDGKAVLLTGILRSKTYKVLVQAGARCFADL